VPIFRGKPELLRAFRAGDRAALETVYRAYVDKVAGIIRFGFSASAKGGAIVSLGDRPQEIADVVQEVFARSFARSAREAFDAGRDYGPYVYTVARNVVIDWVRRAGRELPTGVAPVPRLWGSPFAHVEERSCVAHGDERCLYDVRVHHTTPLGPLCSAPPRWVPPSACGSNRRLRHRSRGGGLRLAVPRSGICTNVVVLFRQARARRPRAMCWEYVLPVRSAATRRRRSHRLPDGLEGPKSLRLLLHRRRPAHRRPRAGRKVRADAQTPAPLGRRRAARERLDHDDGVLRSGALASNRLTKAWA
jgi:DNA-directed RNA polymerase specialized sigma24 family protein